MTPNKITDLEKLLSENNIDGARSLISEILSEKMTTEEEGEVLVNIASLYLDIINSIDTKYEDTLKEIMAGLKDLNVKESKAEDADKLKKIRESLL